MFGLLFCVIVVFEFDGEVGGYGAFGDNGSEARDFISIFMIYYLNRNVLSYV